MNLKNDEFLMLVVAFLMGYFANRILKGCRLLEGIENEPAMKNKEITKVPEVKVPEVKVSCEGKCYDTEYLNCLSLGDADGVTANRAKFDKCNTARLERCGENCA